MVLLLLPTRHLLPCFLAFIGLWMIGGCRQEEPILQYTIDTRVPDALKEPDAQKVADAPKEKIIAAIVPHDEATWFFKVRGSADRVAQRSDQVRDFVQKVTFDASGEPVLSIPDSWVRSPGDQFAFAKLAISTDADPLEMTISKLAGSNDWNQWITINVNRWRRQLGLPPSQQKWAGATRLDEADTANTPSMWVDLTSHSENDLTDSPEHSTPPTNRESPPASTKTEITYDKPASWEPGKPSQMRLASFQVGASPDPAVITVIRAGGTEQDNVGMWASQVWTDEPDAKAIESIIQSRDALTIDGHPAYRYFIKGDGDKAIDVVIVKDQPQSLFIKMTGLVSIVRQEQSNFKQFLESIKFKTR